VSNNFIILNLPLGIGDWGIGPNPQSPIPNPQASFENINYYEYKILFAKYFIYYKYNFFSFFKI